MFVDYSSCKHTYYCIFLFFSESTLVEIRADDVEVIINDASNSQSGYFEVPVAPNIPLFINCESLPEPGEVVLMRKRRIDAPSDQMTKRARDICEALANIQEWVTQEVVEKINIAASYNSVLSEIEFLETGVEKTKADLKAHAEKIGDDKKAILKECQQYKDSCQKLQTEKTILKNQLSRCQDDLKEALLKIKAVENPDPSIPEKETGNESLDFLESKLRENGLEKSVESSFDLLLKAAHTNPQS